MPKKKAEAATELALIGDVDDWEEEVIKALLEVPPGGECTLFIDSSGGSVFGALAVMNLLRYRRLQSTAVVLGECSSATLLIFAACVRRLVTPFSVFFFHRMRWQSDKRVAADEAARWAKHFSKMEKEMDALQARLFGVGDEVLRKWTRGSYYVDGAQLATTGFAELIDLEKLEQRGEAGE